MTHDELLAKIDAEGEFLAQHFDCKTIKSALRAVVKLHKQKGTLCKTCYFIYPCPTIQMIEKELR